MAHKIRDYIIKSVKEQIRCIRAIRDFFECMCS